MTRYFFNVEDSVGSPDDEGTELEGLATAKCEAVKLAGRVIIDAARSFWEKGDWKMTVTDESGLLLFSLLFVGVEAAAISTKT